MLVTRDTRDEAYFYSSQKKERRMHLELEHLRRELRQKIFVGVPAGETFAEVRPAERLDRMRRAGRAPDTPVPAKAPRKPGQAKLPDY
jgi:ERCC4-related helicase